MSGSERLTHSLKRAHLHQRVIDHATTLAEEVEAFLALFTEVRPHESLAWRQPLAMHRADACPFQALSLQEP